MVHALTEAARVLTADGLLLDLRPSSVHRRVEAVSRGKAHLLGVMRERFDDERAADRAVNAALRSGLFEPMARTRFPCNRVATEAEDFRAWLAGYVAMAKLSPHAWLLGRVERAFRPSTWRCCGPCPGGEVDFCPSPRPRFE